MAQLLWAAGNASSAVRFSHALGEPAQAQSDWLMRRIRADADSDFGRQHDFRSIRSCRDFARKVPLREWCDFSPWIDRIRTGEPCVLGTGAVSHLAPTSGSSGARKLIPFTPSLHQSFAEAVGAWMCDLTRLEPGILRGPAYWSISPISVDEITEHGGVPIGFADDAEYLGGWKARIARSLMAVPADLRHERDPESFWLRTASCLLARRDLSLISIWHPSFLDLILNTAGRYWAQILDGLEKGRAAELRRMGRENPERWWPALRVISCWGDLAARPGMQEMAQKFPGCRIQAKGLLATEGVITIPWRGAYPMAVTSHFFEFLNAEGDVMTAHELERGRTYEVVLSNGGGLWRYRLGDMVECDGFCRATPTLRFLGRAGNVSDLCGEKLSEPFVAECFETLWPEGVARPSVAYLKPNKPGHGDRNYVLVLDRPVGESLAERLDALLRRNPNYELAQKLGQLHPLTILVIPSAGSLGRGTKHRRLGDIKPMVLATGLSDEHEG